MDFKFDLEFNKYINDLKIELIHSISVGGKN